MLEEQTIEIEVELPEWLCNLAEKQAIDLSQSLQDALLKELHIDRDKAD